MEFNKIELTYFITQLDELRDKIKQIPADTLIKAQLLDALNTYISHLCEKVGME